MPSLPSLPSRPTQIKLVTYTIALTLTATIGACVAFYNGFIDELIKYFLAGCTALCLFFLAAEEHRMEEMLLRGWQLRLGPRRDSGWGGE